MTEPAILPADDAGPSRSKLAITMLLLDEIRPSRDNPRQFRDDDPALDSLAESISAQGVLEPILVRPRTLEMALERLAKTSLNATSADVGGFEILAGERRWRAAKRAGLTEIPAIIREGLSNQQALELTVTENLQREDLHPLEEAKGIASLLGAGWDFAAVADRLGKSVAWVARRTRLENLSATWRKLVSDPKSMISTWPASHLELVARLETKAQDAFWQANQRYYDVDLPKSRRLRDHLADYTRELRLAPWKLEDATLDPQAGPCSSCPKRSSCNPGLFDEEDVADKKRSAGDRCLDFTCWNRKFDRALRRRVDELEAKHHVKVVFGGHLAYGEKLPDFVPGGTQLVSDWEGRKAKAGEKGAVPVLDVAGDRKGKLEWRVFGSERGSASKGAKIKGKAGEKGAGKSLAERRDQLEQRRAAHALEGICAALEKSKAPATADVIALACAYGTAHTRDRPGEFQQGWKTEILKHLETDAEVQLWESVAQVIARRWRTSHKWYGLKGINQIAPEVRVVTRRIGLDVAPHERAAEIAIPEPKSWAKLAEAEKSAEQKSAKAKRPKKAKS